MVKEADPSSSLPRATPDGIVLSVTQLHGAGDAVSLPENRSTRMRSCI